MTMAATRFAICPTCVTPYERRLAEDLARRQESAVLTEPCARCERTPGPKTATAIVRATSDELIRRGRKPNECDVIHLAREFDSMTREGIVSVALLIAEDLLRERRRA